MIGDIGPTGATGMTGDAGVAGSSAALPFGFAGPLTIGLDAAFTIGFGSSNVGVVALGGEAMPGVIYFRAPREGVLTNLHFSVHSSVGIGLGSTMTATVYRGASTGDPATTPPIFSATEITTTLTFPDVGLSGFESNASMGTTALVNAGDYIALTISTTNISLTSLITIAAGIEFI
jgi:hypothetical protein